MTPSRRGQTRVIRIDWTPERLSLTRIASATAQAALPIACSEGAALKRDCSSDVVLLSPSGRFSYFRDDDSYDFLATQYRVAAATGALPLADLKRDGDVVSTEPVLEGQFRDGKWRRVARRLPEAAALAAGTGMLGLKTVAGLLPRAQRLPRIRSLLEPDGWPDQSARRDHRGNPLPPLTREQVHRALAHLAPQRIPQTLLPPGIRAAWVAPVDPLRDFRSPLNDYEDYWLLRLTATGEICIRVLSEDGAGKALMAALLQPAIGHDDGIDLISHVSALLQGDESVPRGVRKRFHQSLSTFPFYAADRFGSRIAALERLVRDATAPLGGEIYAYLEPGLRDTFRTTSEYNLLQSGHDAERATARRQAVATLWGGAEWLLTESEAGRALLATVDARHKLHAAAARLAKVEPWVIRRLTTTPHEVMDAFGQPFRHCTRPEILQALGPQVRLRSAEDASALANVLWRIENAVARSAGRPTRQDAFLLCGVVARTWVRHGGLAGAVQAANELDCDGFADWWSFLQRALFAASGAEGRLPDADLLPAMREMRAHLLADATIGDLGRWADRYHALIQNVPVGAPRQDDVNEPPELLPTQVLPVSGWTARQLRNAADLRLEGEQMAHCVGMYGDRVRRRESVIFSLESPDGGRITVETQAGIHSGFRLLQARGRLNAPIAPGSAEEAALDEFLSVLDVVAEQAPAKTRQSYQKFERARFYDDGTFVDQMLDTYGNRGWSMLRGALPLSSHGRVERKIEQALMTTRAYRRYDARTRRG